MNVFVLCTGRCASLSFIKACEHIENYSCGHESRAWLIGEERLSYPSHHVEADNRLSWFLGRLDRQYGDGAFYVHLLRDRTETARSFNRRWELPGSIIHAYAVAILGKGSIASDDADCLRYCEDYYDTVTRTSRSFSGTRA